MLIAMETRTYCTMREAEENEKSEAGQFRLHNAKNYGSRAVEYA